MTQDPLRISLELDPGAQPISGRLYEELGGVRSFSGWLGLFAALEAAATGQAPPEKQSTSRGKET
jgi:hypothetical protein